jgi:hypothetical protein
MELMATKKNVHSHGGDKRRPERDLRAPSDHMMVLYFGGEISQKNGPQLHDHNIRLDLKLDDAFGV